VRLVAALLALALAAPLEAQVRPRPGPGDPRLQTIDYAPDQVFLLEVAPGYQMMVELAPDEQIENIAVGDSGAFQVTANRRGDRLFIKPLQVGVTTNMTVITNVRLYAVQLQSLSGPTPEMAFAVRFQYPTPAEDGTGGEEAGEIAGRYRLSGDRSVRPTRIGDDGRHTYIEFDEARALPAVYALDSDGHETLVNGMMRDDVFVLDTVIARLVFRRDRNVARAVRVAERSR
jgi:type IV secretion system protein VirB9